MSASLDNFDYALPPAQIAAHPPSRRDGARLLDVRGNLPQIRTFRALPTLLREGDLAIINDSKVIPARLPGAKEGGGRVEIFAERFLPNGEVLAQIRAARAPKVGACLNAGGQFIVCERRTDGFFRLRAIDRQGKTIDARARFLRRGETPLPPYIRRPLEDDDRRRYQTIFARHAGSVAAPTAGLHFTPTVVSRLAARGVSMANITLHVGAGTFLPLRRGLAAQKLHSERFRVSAKTAAAITAAKKRGGRIVAVGTTVLRALESAADKNGVCAAEGETDLFIKPGHCFRSADLLLTNFHMPRSSLLVLTCAFGGQKRVMDAYRHAVSQKMRFYSYGDAMLLSRADAV